MKTRIGSGFRILVLIAVCLVICGFSVSAETRRPKNVQVALRAKWPGTSLLLEAGELLSKEWKDLFWEFIEVWLNNESGNTDIYTAKDCFDKILSYVQSFLTGPLSSVFELSLTLRSSSPRLVLYQQLAEESLSSYPFLDDLSTSEPNEDRKTDPLLVGINPSSPKGKCCWVDTGGALLFDIQEFQLWLRNANKSGDSFRQPELFEFDHIYFDSAFEGPIAVLYGALGTDCFKEFHMNLVEAAKEGKVKYVMRPVLPSGCESKSGQCGAVGCREPLNLGGYGVELALKNMEYKAMDDSEIKKGVTLEDPHTEDLSQEVRGFIFSRILERKPELTSEIMAFRDSLLSSTVSDTLNVWELKDLGYQAVQRIVHASDPLQSMQEISQNFPSIVSSLSRMKLNDSIKDEILLNQKRVPSGGSLIALNGALIEIEDIDVFLLLDMVHRELSLADQYTKLKIPPSTIRKLLSTLPPPESNALRVDFRSNHVQYINDLEVDTRYMRWRTNLKELLMPVFPGQVRPVRKNLIHAVYVLDPTSICGLEKVDTIITLFENNFPIRFGIILYSAKFIQSLGEFPPSHVDNDIQIKEDLSSLIIRLFLYVKENHGMQIAFTFLSNVNRLRTESVEDAPELHHVEEAFIETLLPNSKTSPQDTFSELEKDQSFTQPSQESSLFVFNLGISELNCCLLMNGLVLDHTEDALLNSMNDEISRIQEQVYFGQITSNTDVLDKFLSESGIPRYNPQIIADKAKLNIFSLTSLYLRNESPLNDIAYLHSSENFDDVKPVTHLLAVDVTSNNGVKLIHEGIRYMMAGTQIARLGFLFNSDLDSDSNSLIFAKVLEITASFYSHKKRALSFLNQVCSLYDSEFINTSSQDYLDKIYELADENGIESSGFMSTLSKFPLDKFRSYLKKVGQFLYGQFGLGICENAIITNGRVISVPAYVNLLSQDFSLLESVEFKKRIKYVADIIKEVTWKDVDQETVMSKFMSDIIMYVSSSLSSCDRSSEGARFGLLSAEYSGVVLGDENSAVHIDAVIDPLSSSGQRLSSLLQVLWKCSQPSIRLVFNPSSSLVDLPLKNYYRFVVPTKDDFSSTDLTIHGPRAFFANMPLSKTLTMNLDVPEPWLVEPVIAVHDLDNILLENLGDTRTLQAIFELEALVLTGHCSEKDNEPPRGLQMIIGTKKTPHLVDTLVMANLGYFQMKVSPGVWYLQLAPGRSSDLYLMQVNQDTQLKKHITIDYLRGKPLRLRVVKKKGKEHEKLLISSHDKQEDWNSNILKWASELVGGKGESKKNETSKTEQVTSGRTGKTINIFSIASGHLYERFLKIMILSVLKNTRRPVKFWFIKNYLSPQFKDVIPHMAQEYGFHYELITYKWPTWLHKQKEKQRIIWAYKILFLDVIFPLYLEKVIFVDADQIIRADMGELYDMNLNGRPLAYTPFCDNNKEMDGYRFWRQGFWKEHLRGRPYHISALYVVDLVKFRETAAGDHLRVYYETLSKDPNSLANLDQDLPNYAQHVVPIFSLPQEWLWCESWCGNSTKSEAKTIDLCNNPMTKEPKLQGAKRIVVEWPDLDLEARHFTSKILGEDVSPIENVIPEISKRNQEKTKIPEKDQELIENVKIEIPDDDQESKAEL